VVIKNYIYILLLIILFFCKTLFSSQIYDYQTDEFIKKINSKILSVNNYNKNINVKIIKDNFPNAFVTHDNTLFISSGLIVYSPDYVSLLAVLAHEIGHLEKYHVTKRKKEINNLKKINTLGNFASILGSMIIQKPELINTIAINQTTINNLYIGFTQSQEKEADLYAVNTLYKLNLSTNSVKELLKIIEDKSNFNLLDNELKKFSTHPLFKERYEILDSKKRTNLNDFDQDLENEFKFIKAKFIAYTDSNLANKLNDDEKIYYEAIKESQSGKLINSLKKINKLISKNKNNNFIIETKADILLSYGYNKEAIEFYQKVSKKYPKNYYIKFNIFMNSKHSSKDKADIEHIFSTNLNLISLFPNHKPILLKYYNLSKILEYSDWISFFETVLFNNDSFKKKLLKLKNITKDNNLKNIIKLYI
jgi:predicted Zn-dependent protease